MNTPKPGIGMKPFGPMIYKNMISDNWKDEINKTAKTSVIEANHRLVGNIDRQVEYTLSEDSRSELVDYVLEYVDMMYDQGLSRFNSLSFKNNMGSNSISMDKPWVNAQKKGEWNPPHMHDGDISCIVYTKIPKILRDEWKHPTQRGKLSTAGKVAFTYGEFMDWNQSDLGPVEPQEKEIYLFPSWLTHFVYPFNADCERISCSTNIYFNKHMTTVGNENIIAKTPNTQIVKKSKKPSIRGLPK